jgi:hypothetical protein
VAITNMSCVANKHGDPKKNALCAPISFYGLGLAANKISAVEAPKPLKLA